MPRYQVHVTHSDEYVVQVEAATQSEAAARATELVEQAQDTKTLDDAGEQIMRDDGWSTTKTTVVESNSDEGEA